MIEFKIGTLLRGILNDLKRRPEDAARDLGVSLEMMHAYLSDERAFPSELVSKACQVWPISPREFALVLDDTPKGVKIMRAEDSRVSGRVMSRKDIPYYEYRDTAASSLSTFRPEWIKELLEVESNDPENSDVQWNNGHFMHQFTYFIGPVNFYYRNKVGEKEVAMMNTGDSMYIRPFVPHTFTTRKAEGGGGLILALTYGGSLLGDAQQELRAVSDELSRNYALNFSDRDKSIASMIEYFMVAGSVTAQELQKRAGLEAIRIRQILSGDGGVDAEELAALAKALGVKVRDLLTFEEEIPSVIISKAGSIDSWTFDTENGSYRVEELASTPNMPMSKSLRLEIDQSECADYGLKIGLHQYLYNTGIEDVILKWRLKKGEFSEVLRPGDSAFMKPFVEHCFCGNQAELVSLRIASKIDGESLRELSLLGNDNVSRVANERMPWFDKRGKN